MRLFIQCTVALFVSLTVLTGTLIIVARQEPLPEPLALLHLTDCAPPCWIGITPGSTTLTEAEVLVQKRYAQVPGVEISFGPPIPGLVDVMLRDQAFRVVINIDTQAARNDAPVRFITFKFSDPPSSKLSIGDLSKLLDVPAYVSILGIGINSVNYVSLNYSSDKMHGATMLIRSGSRLDWTQASYWLRFRDIGPNSPTRYDDTGQPWLIPWRGFTRLENYKWP
ncbi:MAG: hypothetical protein ABI947_01295 [Chloroflexota bacterium]